MALGGNPRSELRERARQRLSDGFDVRQFHDAVLAEGPVPLDVLGQRIDAWTSSQKAVASK